MTPEQTAWVAGIIEGEGHMRVNHVKGRPYGQISVQMTDEDIVRRLREYTGVGRITGPYQPNPPARKPRWTWTVGRNEHVRMVCAAIRPWLGVRRTEQLDNLVGQMLTTSYGKAIPA